MGPREGFTCETSSAPHQECAVVPPDPSRAYIRSGFPRNLLWNGSGNAARWSVRIVAYIRTGPAQGFHETPERTDRCEEPQRPHGEQHVGRYLFLFWKVVVQSSWNVWFVNLGIWSVRRPRAWRRGLMQPMWLAVFLHLPPPASGVQIHKSTEPIVQTLKPLFSRGDRWSGWMECTSL